MVAPGRSKASNATIVLTAIGKLADKDSRLFEGMMNARDKLHPTMQAYQIWADALKPIFTEILGPPGPADHAPPPTGDPSAAPPATRPG